MASVIKCRSCSRVLELTEGGTRPGTCSCGARLRGIPPEEMEAAPLNESADDGAGHSTGFERGTEWRREGDASGPALLLEIPDVGTIVIRAETMLGRDNTEFGDRIAKASNGCFVSGRHAIVVPRDGDFYIRHIGRPDSNQTYLDDQLVSGEQMLHDGQKLSLSSRFHATVRVA